MRKSKMKSVRTEAGEMRCACTTYRTDTSVVAVRGGGASSSSRGGGEARRLLGRVVACHDFFTVEEYVSEVGKVAAQGNFWTRP